MRIINRFISSLLVLTLMAGVVSVCDGWKVYASNKMRFTVDISDGAASYSETFEADCRDDVSIAVVGGLEGLTYQWYLKGGWNVSTMQYDEISLDGADSAELNLGEAARSGCYICYVEGGSGTVRITADLHVSSGMTVTDSSYIKGSAITTGVEEYEKDITAARGSSLTIDVTSIVTSVVLEEDPSRITYKWYDLSDWSNTIDAAGVLTLENVTGSRFLRLYISDGCDTVMIMITVSAVTDGWVKVGDGGWMYFDLGSRVTGWRKISGKWYFFDPQGIMVTGWNQIGGKWYFFNADGSMRKGWLQRGRTWYYLDGSGAMATGWNLIGGKWYYLDKTSGAMQTGWIKLSGKWYYLAPDGAMVTGWLSDGGYWYYLESSGAMVANRAITIEGESYSFDASGHQIKQI